MFDLCHFARHAPAHSSRITFRFEHGDDGFRFVVAKQLTERLFVKADAMFVEHGDEVLRGEARQRGAAEMRVVREIVFRFGVEVGEVTATAAGDADFFGELGRVV